MTTNALRVPRAIVLSLPLAAASAGCTGLPSRHAVTQARTALLGYTENDVRLCAGFPDHSVADGPVEIWSYVFDRKTSPVTVSAPLLFGALNSSLSLPTGGSCKVQFRFRDGRVDRIAYAGDNDLPQNPDAICAPVVENCLSYAKAYRPGT